MMHRQPKRFAPRLLASIAVAAIASGTAVMPTAYAAKGSGGGGTCKRNCSTAVPSVAFVSPSAGATLSGTVSATGSASDSSGISSVQVSVDGGFWTTAAGTTSWSATINTASYTNGSHTLEARATDALGNTSTTMLSVTISNSDTTAPSVSISAPAAGSTVAGTAMVSGTAADNTSLASTAVQVDGGAWQTASGTSSWSWSWNTTALANGTHTVTAKATDSAGNSATTSVTVTVSNTAADTSAPTVAIASPVAGATVAGAVSFSGSSSDNVGVTGVSVQVDGGPWQAASGTTSWSWAWDSTGVANGNHTLTARAVDGAGNAAATSVTVNVSNSTIAPNTQGSWTSPEGVQINVNSAGPWTISQVYSILKANAFQLNIIGPTLTINVQDTYASQTSTWANSSNGVYTQYGATIWLKGVDSTFASNPDSQETHEYGHAWTLYYFYMHNAGMWASYLNERWSTSDGSVTLATDSRTGSSYNWMPQEIIADDYRLLFGTTAAQTLGDLNPYIVDPRYQAGLKDWLTNTWA